MHPFPQGLHGSFRELRRRRLARICGAYVFIAWLAVQIADILFPALFLPEWSVRLVLVVAIIGLPCALVLAWATGGEQRRPGALTAFRTPCSTLSPNPSVHKPPTHLPPYFLSILSHM